jgi:DNA polymerase III sliding clamp (beta) subunit (PCNA family)
MNITIPAAVIKTAQLFQASKDDVRYYLIGLHLKNSKGVLTVEATNGHSLCQMKVVNEAEDFDVILNLDSIKMSPKFLKKPDSVVELSTEHFKNFEATCDNVTTRLQAIEGKFPDAQRFIPTETSGESSQINPEDLMKFKKASQLLNRSKGTFELQHNGLSAALVNIDSYSFAGVVMPWKV